MRQRGHGNGIQGRFAAQKRLAYVARRVRLLQELCARDTVRLRNVPGTANPADSLTKNLKRAEFQEYMRVLYNCDKEALVYERASALAPLVRGGVSRPVESSPLWVQGPVHTCPL